MSCILYLNVLTYKYIFSILCSVETISRHVMDDVYAMKRQSEIGKRELSALDDDSQGKGMGRK